VTLRARAGLASFRSPRIFGEIRNAITVSSRGGFRVIHFSVQQDHLHLIVEADDHPAFRSGIQGLAGRCARAINRAGGRRGRVWDHRYHAHPLVTPSEVRAALVYVLLNFRKHVRAAPAGIDRCSSGPWFDGWASPVSPVVAGQQPVAAAHTWLLRVGWRRQGDTIDPAEAPAGSRLSPARR
jgi:REP element-mobilizing transposase RayT